MRPLEMVVIHCTATPNGDNNFDAQDIDTWHKERGWSAIGYHYVIKVDGTVETGRPLEKAGAHAKGFNYETIGICLIGTDAFSYAQERALVKLLADLHAQHPTLDTVIGHNNLTLSKTCPGFDVKAWMRGEKVFPFLDDGK